MDNMDDSERAVDNNVAQPCFKRCKDLRYTYYVVCLLHTCNLFLRKLEKRARRTTRTRLINVPQRFAL